MLLMIYSRSEMRHFWCAHCRDIVYHIFNDGDSTGACCVCRKERDVTLTPYKPPPVPEHIQELEKIAIRLGLFGFTSDEEDEDDITSDLAIDEIFHI